MEQYSNIDDLLRKRLYDAATPPPDFVWPNVEQALRKKRRRFLFWIFSAFGTAVVTFSIWFWLNNSTANHRLATLNTQPQTTLTQTETINAAAAADNIATPQVTENQAIGTPETPNAVRSELPVQRTRTPHNTFQASSHPVVYQNKNTPEQGRPIVSNLKFQMPGSSENHNSRIISGAADPESVQLKSIDNQGLTTSELALNISSASTQQDALNTLPFSFNPLLFGAKLTQPAGVPFKIIRRKKANKLCYDFGKHPNVWMVDAYAGPSFAFKELSTNNPEFQHYLERRQGTERRDWAFNAGIRGTLMLEQHFMLRFGLHYEQMTEVFELIDPKSINVVVNYHTTYDANGNPITVADTIGVSYGEKYFKSYNRFGMLDIPLQLGVELRKGRMGFNINAGFSFNIWFWKQGAYLNPAGIPRYFTPGGKNTTEIFRTRTGLSAIGSVQWFYHVQPKLRIFAEPYFRQIVQPVNLQSHPIGQRYGVGGIRFGITKILD
ncbi:MAG: hypothetical protein WCR52_03005 [Bacteroidota bacterium]